MRAVSSVVGAELAGGQEMRTAGGASELQQGGHPNSFQLEGQVQGHKRGGISAGGVLCMKA